MIIQGVDFDGAEFTLRWPRELFIYEAKQLLKRSDLPQFPERVAALCGEAFVDADIQRTLESDVRSSIWTEDWPQKTPSKPGDRARDFLEHLTNHPELLQGHVRRRYYAERLNRTDQPLQPGQSRPLATSFFNVIAEMSDAGYFPEILPKICVDDSSDWEPDPSDKISKSIGMRVSWPDDIRDDQLSMPTLYSVIEYFHDEAQRPRQRRFHNFDNCGIDHSDFSKRSGGVVYRWRVNELLEQHGVGLKLGSEAPELGHLIKRASLSLDNLASDVVQEAPENQQDEKGKIESAIRGYRRRGANIHDRRKAVASLADVLEYYRDEFKDVQFTKSDEGDLFQIFNKFTIRHGKKTEQGDYGDEYLDWVFWTTLAAIQLVHRLGIEPISPR